MKSSKPSIQEIDTLVEIPKVLPPEQHREPKSVRYTLIAIGTFFVIIMLILPLLQVMIAAFQEGFQAWQSAVFDEYTIKALQLTLLATVCAVVVNTIFGVFAAWALSNYNFRGKRILLSLIDIPFSVSPVVAGLMYILTYGRLGWMYDFLNAHNIKIVFAVPGVILATIFVTFPYVLREIMPVLNTRGKDEEEAAALFGAGTFRIFMKVTFPHIRWALLYGVVLCTARALGEFGAVSVLSGHRRGETNTLPLQVEILYNQFDTAAAFAVSSILVALAIIILIIRNIVEAKKDASI